MKDMMNPMEQAIRSLFIIILFVILLIISFIMHLSTIASLFTDNGKWVYEHWIMHWRFLFTVPIYVIVNFLIIKNWKTFKKALNNEY